MHTIFSDDGIINTRRNQDSCQRARDRCLQTRGEAAYKRLQNSHPYQSREALNVKHRFTLNWIGWVMPTITQQLIAMQVP